MRRQPPLVQAIVRFASLGIGCLVLGWHLWLAGSSVRLQPAQADPLRGVLWTYVKTPELLRQLPTDARLSFWTPPDDHPCVALSQARMLAPFAWPRRLLDPRDPASLEEVDAVLVPECFASPWKQLLEERKMPGWRMLKRAEDEHLSVQLWTNNEPGWLSATEAGVRNPTVPWGAILLSLGAGLAGLMVMQRQAASVGAIVCVGLIWIGCWAVALWADDLGNTGAGLWALRGRVVWEAGIGGLHSILHGRESGWFMAPDYPPGHAGLLAAVSSLDTIFDWRAGRFVACAAWPWLVTGIAMTFRSLGAGCGSWVPWILALALATTPVVVEALRCGLPEILLWSCLLWCGAALRPHGSSAWMVVGCLAAFFATQLKREALALLLLMLCGMAACSSARKLQPMAVIAATLLLGALCNTWWSAASQDLSWQAAATRPFQECVQIVIHGLQQFWNLLTDLRALGPAMLCGLLAVWWQRPAAVALAVCLGMAAAGFSVLFVFSKLGPLEDILDYHMSALARLCQGSLLIALSVAGGAARTEAKPISA